MVSSATSCQSNFRNPNNAAVFCAFWCLSQTQDYAASENIEKAENVAVFTVISTSTSMRFPKQQKHITAF